jgi:hypothetical protein
MKLGRSRLLWSVALALGSVIAAASVTFGGTLEVRWDIVSIQEGNALPGGVAFAMANDGTLMTLTGSGSVVIPTHGARTAHAVTGGGTWETRGLVGQHVGHGTYAVTDLVVFEAGPPVPVGTPLPLNDLVGDPDDASAGLVVLRIAYSDGSDGILVVSCRLQGTPDAGFQTDTAMMFEGVTVTKGFDAFWRNFRIGDSNRTLFHIRASGHGR